MSDQPLLRLGPTTTDRGKEIALSEIALKINQLIAQIEEGGLVGAHHLTHELGGDDEVTIDWLQLGNVPATFPPSAHAASHELGGSDEIEVSWAQIIGTPTTIAGYGITDAYTKAEVDTIIAGLTFADIGGQISYAQLPSGGGTWANGGDLYLTGGTLSIGYAGVIDIGNALANTGVPITPQLSVVTTSPGGLGFSRFSNDTAGQVIVFTKSRGTTPGDYTIVGAADNVGAIGASAADGIDQGTMIGAVRFTVGGAPAASRIPGIIRFYTAAGLVDDDFSEKMRLGAVGNLGLTATAKIYLDGIGLTGDTYLTESSANVFDVVVGGVTTISSSATLVTLAPKMKVGVTNPFTNDVAVYGLTATAGIMAIRLYNQDQSNTVTQTTGIFMSPDSRMNALTGIYALKENADITTSAARDNSLVFAVALNNAMTDAGRFTSSGDFVVGATSDSFTINGSAFTARAYVKSANLGSHWGWLNEIVTDTASRAPVFGFLRQRVTGAAVANGDRLMQISAAGHDGTDYHEAASIRVVVSGAVASDQVPTDLFFMVGSSAGVLTERWRLLSSGDMAIGATAKFYLDGTAGTGNSYRYESAADLIDDFAGGINALRLDGATALSDGDTSILVNRKAAGASALQRVKWKDASSLAAGDKIMYLAA